MRALDIIAMARDRLGDVNKQRWSDNRLLTITSQGHIDICLESGYLRKFTLIPLVNNQTIYTLPNDCYEVKRVEYNNLLLPLNARNDKDVPSKSLADYVAYKSNLQVNKLEIQPAPIDVDERYIFLKGNTGNDAYQVSPLEGVITNTASNVDIEPLYGTVTSIDYSAIGNDVSNGYGEFSGLAEIQRPIIYPNGNFGVVISIDLAVATAEYGFISDIREQKIIGDYGIITNIVDEADTFLVYYTATPRKLTALVATLVIPDLWEDLLLKYVVGTALQDDNDANNIQRGEYELSKYNDKLATLKDLDSMDYSASSSDKNETTYRRV